MKLENINNLILKIIAPFNLSLIRPANFNNLATIFFENNLVSELYHEKIKNLDSFSKNHLEGLEPLENEIDDVQFYLETHFYHYL